jgi:Protein of unknown function (DUF4230)
VGVFTPERQRERARAPERSREPEPRPRRSAPWGPIAIVVAIVFFVGARDWLPDLIPSLPNPFAEETVDRSGPAVLKSIRDLRELRASSAHYEVVVDLEKDTALPSQLLGERTLFLAAGDVDAMVDFSRLDAEHVQVSGDRRTATITLPEPRLSEPDLDLDRSHVFDRDQGVFNEIGDLFGGNEGSEQELYVLAEDKLAAAAAASPELRARARQNARATLQSLLGSLGFERVNVRFDPTAL